MQAVLFVNYIIVDFQGNHGRPNSQSQAYSRATADNTTSMDIPWALPTYTAPTNFSIGSQLTEPLVNISQIKAHLALLHAFAELKNEVEELQEGTILQMPADLERRWAWFVALAVRRSVLQVMCCDSRNFYIYVFFCVVDLTFGAAHYY